MTEKAYVLEYKACINAISKAVDVLDPLSQKVIKSRYLECEYARCKPWNDICSEIYGIVDDSHLNALYRLHKKALEQLERIFKEAGLL